MGNEMDMPNKSNPASPTNKSSKFGLGICFDQLFSSKKKDHQRSGVDKTLIWDGGSKPLCHLMILGWIIRNYRVDLSNSPTQHESIIPLYSPKN